MRLRQSSLVSRWPVPTTRLTALTYTAGSICGWRANRCALDSGTITPERLSCAEARSSRKRQIIALEPLCVAAWLLTILLAAPSDMCNVHVPRVTRSLNCTSR
ncbi:hypothetical protein EXIGLDRAFT_240009 [Exidia glandulosa HHB12029]|uniref:Uncharacterized protein n=1 Tax=Exidia glandulosa HHB12029 TaxID=1314781 RepID=A0A165ZUK0_EXIGL|nr:hypothetical protein EXIGLDRAFT_240009 [Exidia glandulosa HHB12029]